MGNDMYNDEQLAHAEIVQKETEEALGWWKDRALKAEARLAAAYQVIDLDNAVCLCGCPLSEHEAVDEGAEQCEHEDHECIRVAPAVLEIVTRRCAHPAPPADAATEALRKALDAEEDCLCEALYCEHASAVLDTARVLVSTPAPASTHALARCTQETPEEAGP